MTNYSSGDSIVKSFKNVMVQAVGENTIVNVAATDIVSFQNSLGQALGKTLKASLSEWNTTYFDSLARNGALLNDPRLETPPQLNNSFTQAATAEEFGPIGTQGVLPVNSTSRTLQYVDMVPKHNILIRDCNAGEPGGLAEQVSNLLDSMHANLDTVMRETAKGKRSKLGFSRFWKTDRWIFIRNMYNYMYRTLAPRDNRHEAIPSNSPVIVCLRPDNKLTWTAYSKCMQEPRLRAFPQPGNPYAIGVCPAFWALPEKPVRAFCPYKGRAVGDMTGSAMQLNQQSVIVHQFIRLYLGKEVLKFERFGLNDALDLEATEALMNPSTWAFWYACEYRLFFAFSFFLLRFPFLPHQDALTILMNGLVAVIGCTPLSWNDDEL